LASRTCPSNPWLLIQELIRGRENAVTKEPAGILDHDVLIRWRGPYGSQGGWCTGFYGVLIE